MEVVNQLVAGGNFRVLKEPLGFIKVLEWLFSIFAFGTCGGYGGSFRLSIECPTPNLSRPSIPVAFEYPFRLHQVYFEAPSCLPATPPERVFLVGDHSSAAQFYVTVAVSAFLYSPISLAAYICRPAHFRPGNPAPRIDLLVTSLLAFLWLVSSCAWAVALGDVKAATDPGSVLTQIGACRSGGAGRCRPISSAHMAGLNTSVVFGFLNLVLWAGNIWFTFKESGFGGPGGRPQNMGGVQEKPPVPEGGIESTYGAGGLEYGAGYGVTPMEGGGYSQGGVVPPPPQHPGGGGGGFGTQM